MPALTKQAIQKGVNLGDRDLIDTPRLQVIMCCSRSHLGRLRRGEIRGMAAPFPKSFQIGHTKNRYWRASAIKAWIDNEQAVAEGAK